MRLAFFSTDSYDNFQEAREDGGLYYVPVPQGLVSCASNLEDLALSCKAAIACVDGSVPVVTVIVRDLEEIKDMFERGTPIEKCLEIFRDCVDEDMTDDEVRHYLMAEE